MKLLVTGSLQATPEELERLRSMGHEVTLHQWEKDPVECPEQYEGVICNGLFLYNPIENFTSLRYIQLTSAGYDRVPMDFVQAHGIEIHNARGVYSVPMAEFALCGVLQLYKESRFFRENQSAHRWEKHRGLRELCGKTVCIVGCGSVGTECALRFRAFGCKITGVDLYPHAAEPYAEMAGLDALEEQLRTADVVVLTLPLTAQTHHLMNKERLSLLKPECVFVNIARGSVVDIEALVQALPNLGGAVLDVFETEPLPPESPLWDAPNVIATPHNSFVGEGNHDRLMKLTLQNLEKEK